MVIICGQDGTLQYDVHNNELCLLHMLIHCVLHYYSVSSSGISSFLTLNSNFAIILWVCTICPLCEKKYQWYHFVCWKNTRIMYDYLMLDSYGDGYHCNTGFYCSWTGSGSVVLIRVSHCHINVYWDQIDAQMFISPSNLNTPSHQFFPALFIVSVGKSEKVAAHMYMPLCILDFLILNRVQRGGNWTVTMMT